jgi:predicted Zn-dependent protease with MMP-like domain
LLTFIYNFFVVKSNSQKESGQRLDWQSDPRPVRLSREEFDAVVAEAVSLLPEPLRQALGRVAIVTEDLPSPEMLAGSGQKPPLRQDMLLGLFVGPVLKDLSAMASAYYPPSIFLFQRNLERVCRTRPQLISQIRLTLHHELGHFLGLSEDDLAARGLK